MEFGRYYRLLRLIVKSVSASQNRHRATKARKTRNGWMWYGSGPFHPVWPQRPLSDRTCLRGRQYRNQVSIPETKTGVCRQEDRDETGKAESGKTEVRACTLPPFRGLLGGSASVPAQLRIFDYASPYHYHVRSPAAVPLDWFTAWRQRRPAETERATL
jgi:hypothetical protein